LRRELLTLIVRRGPPPAPGPVISLSVAGKDRAPRGRASPRSIIWRSTSANNRRQKWNSDAARQLTGSHRSIYPRWSERGAGRFYPSDSVRCRARNFASEKTRSASDPDDAGPDLRSIDWCWLCPRTDVFLGWQSRSWLAASDARCGRKLFGAAFNDPRTFARRDGGGLHRRRGTVAIRNAARLCRNRPLWCQRANSRSTLPLYKRDDCDSARDQSGCYRLTRPSRRS